MQKVIKLVRKFVKDKDGKEFPTLFAYKTEVGENGERAVIETPTVVTAEDGTQSTVMKARSFKIGLDKKLAAKLDAEDSYPYFLTIDNEVLTKAGQPQYFITIDKDKDTKKPRLDKNGFQHVRMYIRDVVAYEACPRTDIDFDDIEEYNGK